MRLTHAHVTNFRSVEDSGEFPVEPVTCLVGKNESGKTSLLQALYRLKPDRKESYDVERDYPRQSMLEYKERHSAAPDTVLSTKWQIDKSDQQALADLLGPAAENISSVTIAVDYSGRRTVGISIPDDRVIPHLLTVAGLHHEEQDELEKHTSIAALRTGVEALPQKSPRHLVLLEMLKKSFARNSASLAAIDLLWARVPTFLYFGQYQAMKGRVPVQYLQEKKAGNRPLEEGERTFLDFLAFAGTSITELAGTTRYESLVARFESASNKITRSIFKYWSQNRSLRVRFSMDPALKDDPPPYNTGSILNIRVWNELHSMSMGFDDRSAGFVWFFSFLVRFSQVRKEHGDNLILLLDEPGLSLHAKAQSDLLRYIKDELAPNQQVLYTTHSPFMVPADNLLCARTVEDVVIQDDEGGVQVLGTKVSSDVLEASRDTLFPLQGALGYEITQALFVGENTLVVEGPSDLLYLKAFSSRLAAKGRTGLSPRWTICPVGGVDKVPAFVGLFGGRHLKVAVLVDLAGGQKKKVEELRRQGEVLQQNGVFTYAGITNKAESDVEDMLGDELYITLVNRALSLPATRKIAVPADSPLRIVKYVEEAVRLLPDLPLFDHYSPAEHFIQMGPKSTDKLPGIADADARFERLFVQLNGLV